MTQPNVQPAEPTDQPDPFAEIAAALYRIADDLVTLTGSGLPRPGYIQLSIQPGTHGDDDRTRRAVDAVTSTLLGHSGQLRQMGGGTFHYDNGPSAEPVGPVGVRIYQRVSNEWALKNDVAAAEAELAEREAEAEKARARVAELRGLAYSREPESTVVAPVPAGVEGHPEGRAADRVTFRRQDGTEVDVTEMPGEDAARHLRFVLGDSACGLLPSTVFDGTSDVALVTCEACREVLAPAS